MSNSSRTQSQYYNPACAIQTCKQNCCNFFKICPNFSSPYPYQNKCWYQYNVLKSNENIVVTGGTIAVMVVGSAFALIIFGLIIWCCVKKCKKESDVQCVTDNNQHETATNAEIEQTYNHNLPYNLIFSHAQPYYQTHPYAQPYIHQTNNLPYIYQSTYLQQNMHPNHFLQPYLRYSHNDDFYQIKIKNKNKKSKKNNKKKIQKEPNFENNITMQQIMQENGQESQIVDNKK